jgi:hypothetical protein
MGFEAPAKVPYEQWSRGFTGALRVMKALRLK